MASAIMNKEIRFIVVGKTGCGKSSACNSIARKRKPALFKQTASSQSVTTTCQYENIHFEGKPLLIVDTPGLYDTELTQDQTLKELGKVMGITSPGFHAFVIVLRVGRYTKEEISTVDILAQKFGQELYERSVILFTGVDDLENDGSSFKKYLNDVKQRDLLNLISKCNGRCVGFNNGLKESDPDLKSQVRDLVNNIEKVMYAKKHTYYTNAIYEEVERKFEEERQRRIMAERKPEPQVTDEMRREVETESSHFSQSYQQGFRKNSSWCTIL